MTPEPVDQPEELLDVLAGDPGLHLYGLADLEEPVWSVSRWYRCGDAVAAAVRLPEGGHVGYAMAGGDPRATLDLFADVHDRLPPSSLTVGAVGLSTRLAPVRLHRPLGVHLRMLHDGSPMAVDPTTERLGPSDLIAVEQLLATDPGAAFFLPHMLDRGVFRGIRDGRKLAAVAGTHVLSERYGVAAIGAIFTDPDQRGRGLARRATQSVLADLADRVATVGLNVAAGNQPAIRLYQRLGFRTYCRYEEIELGDLQSPVRAAVGDR